MFDSWCLAEDRRYGMVRNTLCIEGLGADDVNIDYIDVNIIGSVISAENGPRAGCDLSIYLTYAHQPTLCPVTPHAGVSNHLSSLSGLSPHPRGITDLSAPGLGARAFTGSPSERGLDNIYFVQNINLFTFEEAVYREVIGRRPLPPFVIQPAGALQTRVNAVFFGTLFMYVTVHTEEGRIDMYVRPRYRFLTRMQISRNEVTEFASIGRVSPDDFILPISFSFAV